MIDPEVVEEFLAQRRIAVVGVADRKDSFGRTIYQAFRDRGYDAVPVHPTAGTIDGVPCPPGLAAVPGPLDGVVVVVGPDAAVDVVRSCIERGVERVWLFKGIGGPGALSHEAVRLCEAAGVAVVPGACPLMFLQPVGWFHRLHRKARQLNGSLARVA